MEIDIDWDRLTAIGCGPEDKENLTGLVSLFLNSSGTALEAMRVALRIPDGAEFRKHIHRMRGSCSTLGAKRMAVIAEAMDAKARQGDFQGMEAMLDDLESAFKAVAMLLESHVRTINSKRRL